MAHIDLQARELAAAQGGVISAEQAHRLGFTRAQIDYRVRTGLWALEAGFGYRLTSPRDHLDRLRSATALLPKAVVSHESASEIHGFPWVPRGLAVVTVHTRTTHEFPGVRVRRCHDLLAEHVEVVEALPVTTPARTLVDMAAISPPKSLVKLADRLLTAKEVRLEDFRAVVAAVARRGRPGSKILRQLAQDHSGELGATVLERRGRQVLIDGGLPPPIPQYPIPWDPHRRFDDAYPHVRLALDWDSIRWHAYPDAFERDRERDRECVIHDWRLLRFTWRDVHERPAMIVDTVGKALEGG